MSSLTQSDPNGSSPILQLPPEILCKISLLAIQNARIQHRYSVIYQHRRWNWFQIGHICQWWRRIVLGYPILWAVVEVRSPDARRELIQRSRPAPLELEVNLDFEGAEEIEGIVRGEMHRMRGLSICNGKKDSVNAKLFQSLVDARAPALEWFQDHTYVDLPPVLFGGGVPRLRSFMMLAPKRIDWSFNLFGSGLSELALLPFVEFKPLGNESEIVNFLTALAPNIEDLHIFSNSLPHLSTSNELKLVLLPKVREIDLWGSAEGISCITSYITLPPRPVEISLEPRELMSVEQLSSIIPWLAQAMSITPEAYDIAHVFFTTEDNLLRLVFKSELQSTPGIKVDFGLNKGVRSETLCDAIQSTVLATLPVHRGIKTLCIRDNAPTKDILLSAYTRMNAVERVTINPRDVGDLDSYVEFCAALGELGADSRPVLFPALSELAVGHWEFKGMEDWEMPPPSNRPEGKLLIGEALVACLRARKEAGVPLALLQIQSDTRVTKADLENLEECVGSVTWGGEAESDLESGSGSDEDEDNRSES